MSPDEQIAEWRARGLVVTEGKRSALPTPVAAVADVLPADLSERAFQRKVMDLARANGWAAYHTHDSRRSPAGFPDCVFVRERVVWAELKSATGKLRTDQRAWVKLLRPADWSEARAVLTACCP
jgi:hypothetical protein